MTLLTLQLALAGAPANGDFETIAPSGWTDVSDATSNATVSIVEQGTQYGGGADTTGIVFPSPSRALLLQNGPFSVYTPAIVASAPFLVTHQDVAFQHRDESAAVSLVGRFDPEVGNVVVLGAVVPSVGVFGSSSLDVSAFCGERGAFQLAQNGPTDGAYPLTLVDEVEVSGLCDAYVDADGDGHCPLGQDLDGDGACTGEPEAFAAGEGSGDCDDTDPTLYPGAPEVPSDGIDQDCSGADFVPNCYADVDGDGFGGEPIEGSLGCGGEGEASVGGDCDDARSEAFPGAQELCNGLDDDCDGSVETAVATLAWPDADEDGYGDHEATPFEVCGTVLDGAENGDDCDDQNPFVNPGAGETAGDGLDQDCDGLDLCYVDADGDSWGAIGQTTPGPLDCDGFATRGGDCDDARDDTHPEATEYCNDNDDDCDGALDEGFGATTYFVDDDGDGFGADASARSACEDPGVGWMEVGGDCDDTDPDVNPDATEVRADGVDQDCDGYETCFTDEDDDGHGTPELAFDPNYTCLDAGFALVDDDCDDTDAAVSPSAVELPANGIDDDCDGQVDPVVLPPPGVLVFKGGACSSVGTSSLSVGLLLLLPWLLRRRS